MIVVILLLVVVIRMRPAMVRLSEIPHRELHTPRRNPSDDNSSAVVECLRLDRPNYVARYAHALVRFAQPFWPSIVQFKPMRRDQPLVMSQDRRAWRGPRP